MDSIIDIDKHTNDISSRYISILIYLNTIATSILPQRHRDNFQKSDNHQVLLIPHQNYSFLFIDFYNHFYTSKIEYIFSKILFEFTVIFTIRLVLLFNTFKRPYSIQSTKLNLNIFLFLYIEQPLDFYSIYVTN